MYPFLSLFIVIILSLDGIEADLTYRFTGRVFLPAACHRTYSSLNKYWNYVALGKPIANANYPNGTGEGDYKGGTVNQYCPIWNDIAEGKYNGHPDFETASSMVREYQCKGSEN
jgi:hypothetical protein